MNYYTNIYQLLHAHLSTTTHTFMRCYTHIHELLHTLMNYHTHIDHLQSALTSTAHMDEWQIALSLLYVIMAFASVFVLYSLAF